MSAYRMPQRLTGASYSTGRRSDRWTGKYSSTTPRHTSHGVVWSVVKGTSRSVSSMILCTASTLQTKEVVRGIAPRSVPLQHDLLRGRRWGHTMRPHTASHNTPDES